MYFKNLDPLRGFLALVVVVFHIVGLTAELGLPGLPILTLYERGPESVLVFFSLSGYLIIGQLYDEKLAKGSIAIKQFYIRRILRLYPVYYLVLSIGLIIYFLVLPKMGILEAPEYSFFEAVAYNVAMLPNVFKYYHDPGIIFEIMWSIGIEEQFYLFIAPILTLIPLNKYLRNLVLFTVIYFIVFHLEPFQILRNYFMVFFFMSGGGVMAILQRKNIFLAPRSKMVRWVIYALFAVVFTTNWLHFDNNLLKHGAYLITFMLFIPTLSNSPFSFDIPRWATWTGKISYGIYMYHMIVVYVVFFVSQKVNAIEGVPGAVVIAINWVGTIAGTLLVSHLSYQYFEKFFLKLKDKYRILK